MYSHLLKAIGLMIKQQTQYSSLSVIAPYDNCTIEVIAPILGPPCSYPLKYNHFSTLVQITLIAPMLDCFFFRFLSNCILKQLMSEEFELDFFELSIAHNCENDCYGHEIFSKIQMAPRAWRSCKTKSKDKVPAHPALPRIVTWFHTLHRIMKYVSLDHRQKRLIAAEAMMTTMAMRGIKHRLDRRRCGQSPLLSITLSVATYFPIRSIADSTLYNVALERRRLIRRSS